MDSMQHYMNLLSKIDLLDRKKETKLLSKVRTLQQKILTICISSKMFRLELAKVLQSPSFNDVTKVSTLLDQNSKVKDINEIESKMVTLVNMLQSDGPKKGELRKALNDVSLSCNVINGLLTNVKVQFSAVKDYETTLHRLYSFFEVPKDKQDPNELKRVIHQIKFDSDFRSACVKEWLTDDKTIFKKIHEFNELELSLIRKSANYDLNDYTQDRILFKEISNLESELNEYRNQLVKGNLRLVMSRAKNFVNRGLEFDDLVQEGNLGLIRAINKFDHTRGAKLGTFATWWIDQGIRRAISNKSKTVRIPTNMEFVQTQLAQVVPIMTTKLGRKPTIKELSVELKVSEVILERLRNSSQFRLGIDDPIGDARTTLGQKLPAEDADNPFSVLQKKMARERVLEAVKSLPPQMEKIIRLRYGLGEHKSNRATLKEVLDSIKQDDSIKITSLMGVLQSEKRGLKLIKPKLSKLRE